MLLLPDLATKILEDMDVESITQELQSQTRASRAHSAAKTHLPSSDSSMTSSVEIPPNPPPINDARSDNGSVSVVSYTTSEEPAAAPDLSASSHSWVERMSATSSAAHSSPEASHSNPPGTSVYSYAGSPRSNLGTELSDSFVTTSSAVSYGDTRVRLDEPIHHLSTHEVCFRLGSSHLRHLFPRRRQNSGRKSKC